MTVALATVSFFFAGCEDEVSGIGNSLAPGEVSISVDSLTYSLYAATVSAPEFDSRSSYTLLGSLKVPEYGSLSCSYVTQFLPSEALNIPDSISSADVDSVKMILTVPKSYITGDTLAPQQLSVYSLTRQLPSDISSTFNPEGYYNPSAPLSVKNYSLSGYSFTDSTFSSAPFVQVKAPLPVEFGRDVFEAYAEDPGIFVWPEKFAQLWPGVFVEPSFGKGCVAPVQNTSIYAYFPKTSVTYEKDEEGVAHPVYKTSADSVCMFTTAPEVLSSVNIDYRPSESLKEMVDAGKSIITTPGGYTVSFSFPAVEILDKYWDKDYNLGVINNLRFSIPVKPVPNSYGIGIAPALLMVKTSELDSFFAEGRLPDNKTSFTSTLSSAGDSYVFSGMRQYIVSLKEKGRDNITADDVDFTLVPVTLTTEDFTDNSTGTAVTMVTNVTPYIIMPTMAELDTENALVVFTFSNQTLN